MQDHDRESSTGAEIVDEPPAGGSHSERQDRPCEPPKASPETSPNVPMEPAHRVGHEDHADPSSVVEPSSCAESEQHSVQDKRTNSPSSHDGYTGRKGVPMGVPSYNLSETKDLAAQDGHVEPHSEVAWPSRTKPEMCTAPPQAAHHGRVYLSPDTPRNDQTGSQQRAVHRRPGNASAEAASSARTSVGLHEVRVRGMNPNSPRAEHSVPMRTSSRIPVAMPSNRPSDTISRNDQIDAHSETPPGPHAGGEEDAAYRTLDDRGSGASVEDPLPVLFADSLQHAPRDQQYKTFAEHARALSDASSVLRAEPQPNGRRDAAHDRERESDAALEPSPVESVQDDAHDENMGGRPTWAPMSHKFKGTMRPKPGKSANKESKSDTRLVFRGDDSMGRFQAFIRSPLGSTRGKRDLLEMMS